FPHHENEIAQSESFTSVTPFVHYWIHNGLMQLGEDKMSKSSGKLVSIDEALARYSADSLRLWVLSSHYRGPITYSDDIIASIERGRERLLRAASTDLITSATSLLNPAPYRQQFIQAMDDDFSTPQAIAILFDLAHDINRGHTEGMNVRNAHNTFLELAGVLGLKLEFEPVTPDIPLQGVNELAVKYGVDSNGTAGVDLTIRRLLEKRAAVRREKNWQLADEIRNDLKELGITLEDTADETVWRYKKS
ncbi:MAG: cysteine--tRNA ligase, partial [Dehalococcoidia bacterium]|nr:cysteine--tRNA ligase [Dehalococcoidia bacterium]